MCGSWCIMVRSFLSWQDSFQLLGISLVKGKIVSTWYVSDRETCAWYASHNLLACVFRFNLFYYLTLFDYVKCRPDIYIYIYIYMYISFHMYTYTRFSIYTYNLHILDIIYISQSMPIAFSLALSFALGHVSLEIGGGCKGCLKGVWCAWHVWRFPKMCRLHLGTDSDSAVWL